MSTDVLAKRPCQVTDIEFQRQLFVATRRQRFAAAGLLPAMIDTMLSQQFDIQRAAYADAYPAAQRMIVMLAGVPIGRMIVDRSQDRILLVDIAVIPESQGRGIGTRLLTELIDESNRSGSPIQLQVDRDNPAIGLYELLGFTFDGEQTFQWLMQRKPTKQTTR